MVLSNHKQKGKSIINIDGWNAISFCFAQLTIYAFEYIYNTIYVISLHLRNYWWSIRVAGKSKRARALACMCIDIERAHGRCTYVVTKWCNMQCWALNMFDGTHLPQNQMKILNGIADRNAYVCVHFVSISRVVSFRFPLRQQNDITCTCIYVHCVALRHLLPFLFRFSVYFFPALASFYLRFLPAATLSLCMSCVRCVCVYGYVSTRLLKW